MNSGINKCVERIMVERNKKVNSLVFGEITKMATENGLDTIISLNEEAIVSALQKQIPQKPIIPSYRNPKDKDCGWYVCPCCKADVEASGCYCHICGQKLDWRNAE